MAKYVDIENLDCDTEWDYYYDGFVTYSKSTIDELPIANVVEREKIDKAIEEINNEEVEVDFMNDYDDGFNSGLFKALEILKRNIGE